MEKAYFKVFGLAAYNEESETAYTLYDYHWH